MRPVLPGEREDQDLDEQQVAEVERRGAEQEAGLRGPHEGGPDGQGGDETGPPGRGLGGDEVRGDREHEERQHPRHDEQDRVDRHDLLPRDQEPLQRDGEDGCQDQEADGQRPVLPPFLVQ